MASMGGGRATQAFRGPGCHERHALGFFATIPVAAVFVDGRARRAGVRDAVNAAPPSAVEDAPGSPPFEAPSGPGGTQKYKPPRRVASAPHVAVQEEHRARAALAARRADEGAARRRRAGRAQAVRELLGDRRLHLGHRRLVARRLQAPRVRAGQRIEWRPRGGSLSEGRTVALALERDALESIAVAARLAGRGADLAQRLDAIDRTARASLTALTERTPSTNEPRLAAVSWSEPEAWWGTLAR